MVSSSPTIPEGSAEGSFLSAFRLYAVAAARRHKGVALLLSLLFLASIAATVRLSGYMFSPARTDLSLVPNDPFLVRHSCLSSYVAGAALFARGDANLYEASHYRKETADHGIDIGEMDQDPYQYPPFLLVPFRALLAFSHDFATLRAIWFVIQGALVLISLILVARHIGGERGFVALLLLPMVWGGPPNLAALQFGNIQAIVVGAAILGMVCIDRRWVILGSGLLAVAILAKIFPIVLVIYLVARRHWRAVAATAAWGILLSTTVVLVGGLAPWIGFLTYQLPRLSSGEAFIELFEASPISALINLAYSSLPYKLQALGWIEAPHVSRFAASLGNLMVLVAALFIGLHDARQDPLGPAANEAEASAFRLQRILGWLALINLSTLQSTMSPHYAVFGTSWLLALWAAGRRQTSPGTTAWLLFGAIVALSIATPSMDKLAVAAALVVQLANIGFNLAVAVGRGSALFGAAKRPAAR